MKKIIYDETEITVEETNSNVMCTVTNNTDEIMMVVFIDEYDYVETIRFMPYEKISFFDNEDGNAALNAFKSNNFYTITEDNYEEDFYD